MTTHATFWIAAALLLGGALALIVPPLWSGGTLAARARAAAAGGVVVLVSLGGYTLLGDPQAIGMGRRTPPPVPGAAPTPQQIQNMVAALAARLKAEPGNSDGWARLGRSYVVLGRYRDAAIALRRAVDQRPADATLLADLADVLALNQGRRLAGEPATLVQRALDADPRHAKALSLAGSVAFEAHDPALARAYWERLLPLLPPDGDAARSVRGSIAQARALESSAIARP